VIKIAVKKFFKLLIDNLPWRGLHLARERHPKKEVEEVLRELEALGWTGGEAEWQRSRMGAAALPNPQ